jgi:pimeloyl-ACP methyl ester carboxylesterase
MGSSRHDWDHLAPALHMSGYCTYEVDLLGHGDSPKPDDLNEYHMQAVYQSLENWLVEMEIEKPFSLVGHSMGGYLSMRLGLEHPEWVRSIVLIDPLVGRYQLAPIFRLFHRRPQLGINLLPKIPWQLIDAVLSLDPIIGRAQSGRVRQLIVDDIKRASPNILNLPRTLTNLENDISRLQLPAQVIWGEKDLTLSPKSFPAIVSRLSNAEGHAIPNCGHQPHLICPELVNQLVLNFLNQTALLNLSSSAHQESQASTGAPPVDYHGGAGAHSSSLDN